MAMASGFKYLFEGAGVDFRPGGILFLREAAAPFQLDLSIDRTAPAE
jgi:hypothetical protein